MSGLPDFSGQEERLFQFTVEELRTFSANRREPFAYFAFDCNPDYGEILLCLDTAANSMSEARKREQSLWKSRQEWQSPPYAEIPPYTLEWVIHRLGNDLDGFVLPFGNNTGDFSDQGFAQLEFEDWDDFSFQEPREFPDSQQTRIACYAAVLLSKVIDRLVDGDAFAVLNRTHPFYCGIGLHDGPQRVLRLIE